MAELTLQAIEELMDGMLDKKLSEQLEPIKATLSNHTASLELLLTQKQAKDDNTVVDTYRVDRLEEWAKQAGNKIGVQIEL